MDPTSENISRVVAILTAILSGQEDTAYAMVLESNPVELFSALTGVLLSTLQTIAQINGQEVEDYLQQLGMVAFNNEQ
jgi:type III secretory pathway component EscS